MKKISLIAVTIALSLAACSKPKVNMFKAGDDVSAEQDPRDRNGEDPAAGGENGSALTLTCSAEGAKTYKGFGDMDLTAGRALEIPALGDRYRVKPYSALEKEFLRVTGNVPKSLAANASTFAAAGDRWYSEPQGSAVTLFTTYRIAYEAALNYTATDAKWNQVPTDETAKVECQLFARAAWNREASESEIAACQNIAVVETATETDAKMRWAYALASVMNATGFIAY